MTSADRKYSGQVRPAVLAVLELWKHEDGYRSLFPSIMWLHLKSQVTLCQLTASQTQPSHLTAVSLYCMLMWSVFAAAHLHQPQPLPALILLSFMHDGRSLFLNWSPMEGLPAMLLACYFKRIFRSGAAGSIRTSGIMPSPFDASAPDRNNAGGDEFIHTSIPLQPVIC